MCQKGNITHADIYLGDYEGQGDETCVTGTML